jgi:peptidyl-prolyl cis-trans isomerase C
MHHHLRAVTVVVALLLLAAPLHAEEVVKPPRDDDVVARVNGTTIYRKAVREVVQGILAMQDAPPDDAAIGKLAADAIDSLIALELLYQESQAHQITVSDAAVDEEIARSKSHFPDGKTFQAALKARGMTEHDLQRDTRKTMAVNRLLEGGVWKDVRVSPEQIKTFYEQNHEEFKHPPEIRASHILIRVPDGAIATERDAAKQRATALLDKLKAGVDFAQLAREQSQDPGTAPTGGDLGYFGKGDMVDAFEKAAFALQPGQLSGLVTTPYGFHIIKVTDHRDAGYEPLAEVQERISAVLMKTERQRRQADLVAQLRQKAKVELLER